MLGFGTRESGHANIGDARASCGEKQGKSLGTCMRSYFKKHGVKCMPRAKSCHSKKKAAAKRRSKKK